MLRHVKSRLGSTLSTERIMDVDRLSIRDVIDALSLERTGDPETDRQLIEEVLAEPDSALSVLEQIPVACLVVLEGLIEMRGHAGPWELRELIRERTALTDDHLEDIASLLAIYGLATVSPRCARESEPNWLFLTTAAAQCCPALLRGLTLPRPPAAPPISEPYEAFGGQAMLPFLQMLDRSALRITSSGRLHRADQRRYVRALDCSEGEFIDLYLDAIDLGLLGTDGAWRIWPFREGIRRAIARAFDGPTAGSLEPMVWQILPDDRSWVSEEAVARAVVRMIGVRDFTTTVRGVRSSLRPTIWVERGRDVSGLFLRRRDPARWPDVFADDAGWERLARYPLRPAYLRAMTRSKDDIERELSPFFRARIGDHDAEKESLPDVPEGQRGLWVPLACGAPESLRVRYEQAMAHRFEGDAYELRGGAHELFSGTDWRPRPFSQTQLHAALEDAALEKRAVQIHIDRGDGLRVHWVRPVRVHAHGNERSVIAVDLETDLGLVFPLSQVIEVDTTRRFTG